MKPLLTFSAALLLFFLFVNAKGKPADPPPGTVIIEENFYADYTEVSNLDWREYIYWLENSEGAASTAQAMSPTIEVLPSDQQTEYGTLQEVYFEHSAFDHHPIVGITHEQAAAYCQWRSERVNEQLWIKHTKGAKKQLQSPNFSFKAVDVPQVYTYRLPSPQEWLQLAQLPVAEEATTPAAQYPAATIAPKSPKKTLYGFSTNVSELTATAGIVMGGNWKDGSHLEQREQEGASSTVGFRCVCEKKPTK